MAFAALAVLTLSVTGAVALVWLAATTWGRIAPSGNESAAVLAAGVLVGIGLAIVGLVGVMRRVAMPLGGVMDAADRVAAGNYDVRVVEHGPPSIRALARAFNTMTARLQDSDRLRRDLMADIAHELRTQLTVIQGKLEGLLDGVYPCDDAEMQLLLDETRVLSRLIEDLRTLALSEGGVLKLQCEPTDIAGLARDVARVLGDAASERRVRVEIDAPGNLPSMHIDPMRIREVIGNLLANAVRHTPSDGLVTIHVTAAPDGGAAVEVRDTGVGMTPEELARAFDRFYKGSQSRGSGLGLTIARSLVAAHGGEIHASSAPGHGTAMTFTLPPAP